MKNYFFLIVIPVLFTHQVFSQANCSNPVVITMCPDSTLYNQTNSGMGDDAPWWCNVTGEDVLYEIQVPAMTQNIYVNFENLTHRVTTILMNDTCDNHLSTAHTFFTGSGMYCFPVSGSTKYFLWVDCSVTVNFDISFGADTAITAINHPDTQGNLAFDTSGCGAPMFSNSKPFFQIAYNNVYQVKPMTLAPLFTQGTMCLSTYFRNTTGDEGVGSFVFSFDIGYSNISSPDSIRGTYNAGYWIKTSSGQLTSYVFIDSLQTGRGDFDGSPDSCLRYEFCFELTPLSNDPALTNIRVLILSDGYGTAFNGTVASGCCPSFSPGCHLGSGGAVGGVNGFAFGADDPGTPLPITVAAFDATLQQDRVLLQWITASEVNNDFFSIERSRDGKSWETITRVEGSGNSTEPVKYETKDSHPLRGTSYYRLMQTDYDGNSTSTDPVTVHFDPGKNFLVYPNPVSDRVFIENKGNKAFTAKLFSSIGNECAVYQNESGNRKSIDVSGLAIGIYFLTIEQDDEVIKNEIVTISR